MSTAGHRRESRDRYHTVLRVVDAQTSPKQPPMASKHVVVRLVSRLGAEGHSPDDVRSSIQAAVANGDLLKHRGRLAPVDDASLLRCIEAAADQVPPDHELVAKCNRLMKADS